MEFFLQLACKNDSQEFVTFRQNPRHGIVPCHFHALDKVMTNQMEIDFIHQADTGKLNNLMYWLPGFGISGVENFQRFGKPTQNCRIFMKQNTSSMEIIIKISNKGNLKTMHSFPRKDCILTFRLQSEGLAATSQGMVLVL